MHDRLDVGNARNRKVLSFRPSARKAAFRKMVLTHSISQPWRVGCPCLILVLTAHGKAAGKNQFCKKVDKNNG